MRMKSKICVIITYVMQLQEVFRSRNISVLYCVDHAALIGMSHYLRSLS